MADEQEKKSFKEQVVDNADRYEADLRENAAALKEIIVECVQRGIKTKDQVLADAKKAGVGIKEAALDKWIAAKQRVTDVRDAVVDTKDKVVRTVKDKAESAKDTVRSGATKVARGAVRGAASGLAVAYLTGRLGRNVAIKGAKTVGSKGKKVYTAAKGTAQKGLEAVKGWFKARGKDFVELGKAAKDKVLGVRDNIVDTKDRVVSTVREKAENARDKVVDTKDRIVSTVEDKAESAKDAVRSGATAVARSTVNGIVTGLAVGYLTGRLGRQIAIKGAKTVGNGGKKVFTATKGTAQRGLETVEKWFEARGKNLRELGIAAKEKVLAARDRVVETKDRVVETARDIRDTTVEKAEQVRDNLAYRAAKTVAVPVTAARLGKEAIEMAQNKVASRTNTTIINMTRSGREFMTGLFDKLENAAISREERRQERENVQTQEATKDSIETGER